MSKRKPTESDVRKALEELYRGTQIEEVMKMSLREERAKANRKVLLEHLWSQMTPEFLSKSSHVLCFSECGERSNQKAIEAWVDHLLEAHPEQLSNLTRDFVRDTCRKIKELIDESTWR